MFIPYILVLTHVHVCRSRLIHAHHTGVLSPLYKGFVPAAVSPLRSVALDSPTQGRAFASFVGQTPRRDSPAGGKRMGGDSAFEKIELKPFKLKQM